MLHRTLTICLSAILAALLATMGMAQTTDGTLKGTVKDEEGKLIPEVKVEMKSKSTGRTYSAVTDNNGRYRFPALPIGDYSLMATKQDYQKVIVESVTINLGDQLVFPIEMEVGAFEDTITISADSLQIETTKTSLDTTVETEVLENLPLFERDFRDILLTLNNTSVSTSLLQNSYEGENQINISGARSRSNIFQIDGAAASSSFDGQPTQFYSMDVIDELQLTTAGYSAEYGRGAGGVVNVVTKSGGERIAGRVSYYYRDDSLDTNTDEASEYEWDYYEISGLISGPIQSEELFYLANFTRVQRHDKKPYSLDYYFGKDDEMFLEDEYTRNAFFGKLNWYPSIKHEFTVTGNYEPYEDKQPYSSSFRPERDGYTEVRGGFSSVLSHKWTMSNEMLLESNISASYTEINTERNTPDDPPVQLLWYIPGSTGRGWLAGYEGPFRGDSLNEETKIVAASKLNYFMDETKWGSMNWTFGGDIGYTKIDAYEENLTHIRSYYGTLPPDTSFWYKWQDVGDPNIEFSQSTLAAFAQNDWQTTDRLTINLGLRLDYNDFLENAVVAPRSGFAFDPFGDQKTVVRGGFGVYYDRNFFQNQRITLEPERWTWRDNTRTGNFPDEPNTPTYTYQMDDDIKTPYTYEFSAGIERLLWENISVTVDAIYRKNEDQFFKYYTNLPDENTDLRPNPELAKDVIIFGNQGWSDYKSLGFSIHKRFEGRWMARINYNWSESVGNGSNFFGYGGSSLMWATQQNQDSWLYGEGPTNFDIPHQWKFTGIVVLPFEVMFSFNSVIRSPGPVTVQDYIFGGPALPEPINTERMPGGYYKKTDVRFQKTFSIGEHKKLHFYVDMINAFNNQNIVYTQRWRYNYGGVPNEYFLSEEYPYDYDNTDRDRETQLGVKFDF